MIEVRDRVSTDKLHKHAVVFNHLLDLYEKQWLTVYEKLDGIKRALIFEQAFGEMIYMAQEKYLKDYYERIKNNAV